MKYEAILFDYAGTIAYESKANPTLQMPEQMIDLIKKLYGAGYRLAIVSNSHRYGDRHWLCNYLQEIKLLSYFECVTSSGAWGIHKPDANIYMRTLLYMGVLPNRALMVGNSQSCDVDGDRRAGLEAMYADLDKDGLWEACLLTQLNDKNLECRKPNLITDYMSIGSNRISCQVRHLSHPLKKGDYVIVGGNERQVSTVSQELTHADVVNAKRSDTVEIRFVDNPSLWETSKETQSLLAQIANNPVAKPWMIDDVQAWAQNMANDAVADELNNPSDKTCVIPETKIIT